MTDDFNWEKLWDTIESVGEKIPSANPNPNVRIKEGTKLWLRFFTGQENDKEELAHIADKLWKNKKIQNFISKSRNPDTSPDRMDISILTFSIVSLYFFGKRNKGEKFFEKNISNLSLPISSPHQIQQSHAGKYILTFVISESETELLAKLKEEGLTNQNAEQLFRAKEWIHYCSEDIWNHDCQNLFETKPDDEDDSIGDVFYVKILTNKEEDKRFGRESNMLKMYDAFMELLQADPKTEISVSLPRSRKTYENRGFYKV